MKDESINSQGRERQGLHRLFDEALEAARRGGCRTGDMTPLGTDAERRSQAELRLMKSGICRPRPSLSDVGSED